MNNSSFLYQILNNLGRMFRPLNEALSDDYLFAVVGESAPLYAVHLTWSKESDPFWPASVPFRSKEDFIHGWEKIFD